MGKNKKIEFSKVMLLYVTFFVTLISFFAIGVMAKTKDLSALEPLVIAWFAEFGVATGFYYNKAKAENKLKLMKKYSVQPLNDDFREE